MPDAEIHLYESGKTASFLSCGIQSYLENVSKSLDELHYATADSYKEQGVNVHVNSDVVNINPEEKTITVKTSSGEREESYDKLFLSSGAVPFELPVPGNDMQNVYYLRGHEWADVVNQRMSEAKQSVVIGGGYIGIEDAQSFTKAGIKTTVILAQVKSIEHIKSRSQIKVPVGVWPLRQELFHVKNKDSLKNAISKR